MKDPNISPDGEKNETKYKYAIVYARIDEYEKRPYTWGKYSKYKSLISAEMGLKTLEGQKVCDWLFRIVPYFNGHWWTNTENERKAYLETNAKIWQFLRIKGIDDECRKYLKDERTK